MLDRLVSGAGAVADVADRFARIFTRRAGGDLLGGRPGSAIVAVLLAVLAAVLVAVGLEATDDPELRDLRPADVSATEEIGGGNFSTMSGGVALNYIETFFDDNGNGTQEDGEPSDGWTYFLVDPETRSGLAVRSDRPPLEVYRIEVTGTAYDDPTYIDASDDDFADELEEIGITLDRTRLIDATLDPIGSPQAVDLAADLPADMTPVTIAGPRTYTWVPTCATDVDGNDLCDDDEVTAYDVVIYDEASKRGVLALVRESPEFAPATFAGMLRRDERGVSGALATPDLGFEDLGITISDQYVLDDGATPASAPLAFGSAIVAGSIAGLIVIGLAGGYLVFRRDERASPAPATSMAIGDRIPLHVTGRLRGPDGEIHVREAPADLVRFQTSVSDGSSGDPEGSSASAASTLIVERVGLREGVAIGRGELSRSTIGRAVTFRGPRAAIRAVAGTGPIVLSFETAAERDRAAAELLDETRVDTEGA